MHIPNIRQAILSVRDRWNAQYPPEKDKHYKFAPQTRANLAALNLETATDDDVTKAIGNTSWVMPTECVECGDPKWDSLVITIDDCYEKRDIWICFDCLQKAFNLVSNAKKGVKQ